MNEHVTEKLSAYYDGELGAEETRAVEEHVAGCGRCAAELAEMKALSSLLRRRPGTDVSAGARKRWHWAVEGTMNRRGLDRMALRLALVAACVAVVGVIWNVTGTGVQAQTVDAWEKDAVSPAQDTTSQREAALADWMVAELSTGRTAHE